MKRFLRYSTFALLFAFRQQLFAATISGLITSDTTWFLVSSPVIVTGTVTIANGAGLTIQSGVTVKFSTGTALIVSGKIIADGVLFTSNAGTPAPGDWSGFEFGNTANVGSIFKNNTVEFAGGGVNASGIFYKTGAFSIAIDRCTIRFSSAQGINTRASSPLITNSRFERNSGYAIYSDLLSNFVIDSCTIINNTIGGVRISINATVSITNSIIDTNGIGIFVDNSAIPTIRFNKIRKNSTGIQFTGVGSPPPTIKDNTISGNTTSGFRNTGASTVIARQNYWGSDLGPYHPTLNPTGLGDKVTGNVDFQPWTVSITAIRPVRQITANISTNTIWADSVYWVKNSITITAGTLTIKPGVIVKFALNAYLTVNGIIAANGTPDSLIVFTSDKDDPYGGDTNGDSTATGPNRGNWGMVWIQGAGSSFNNCLFRFGGSWGNGNLRVDNATTSLNNIFSTQSSSYGLYFNTGGVTLSNSTSTGNSSAGIYLWNSNATITGSTINGNSYFGIWAQGTSRFSVRKSVINGNSNTGIHADYGASRATLVLLDSSTISNNAGNGIYSWYSGGSQRISYNRIDGNLNTGIWCYNVDSVVTIVGDTIVNNGNEGISTSNAIISNNVIQGNRYPIALIGRVNSTYSGNTISGNQYNNAVALRMSRYEESFSDTLKATLPAGMTLKTYVLIENTPGYGVISGQTLVIQPGVIIKFVDGMYMRSDGTIIARGTAANPIVFTSYRDNTYGGKTNLVSDTTSPAPNDWQYLRIRELGSVGSVISNCIFKYAGKYSNGALWIDYQASLTSPIDSILVRKSGTNGIYVSNALVTITNATVDSNGSYGIYIDYSSPRADVIVRTSAIRNNGNEGLRAVGNSAFREVSNCFVQRNGGWGIGTDNGTIPQVFQGNIVTNNVAGGIYNNSTGAATDLLYIGNTVADNGGDGILSSRASFIDNTIQRNRFPLAVWRRLGNIYVDNRGLDGNVISGNVYNNAIAIWDGPVSDTLKATFPQSITSKTYVAIYNFQVDGGTTLVIEPGVKIKFQQIPTNTWRQFNVYGTLIAQGTSLNPIIFTSWRDSIAGGKTTSLTDFGAPAPGDWYFVAFRDGSGSSVIRNCQFKYGGRDGQQTLYFAGNLGGLVFSNNLIRRSSSAGIFVVGTTLTIDSTTVDSCGYSGIQLYYYATNNVSLRNSKFLNNGSHGIWAQGQSKFSVISNCVSSGNNGIGIYIENNTIPLSIIGNVVNNNRDHGIYVLSRNDAIDTLLIIAGNNVRNNGLVGIFSSRAYVIDDSITGNRFAIGVTGQISLDGSTNAAGNIYQGVVTSGNKFEKTLITEENVFGRLGLSYPAGYTSKVIAVRGNSSVPSGTTLTIAPGTVLKFPVEYGWGRFQVDGAVLSEGTTSNKIVFTSWKDDTYGGDSNADTSATVPAASNWDMVYLNGSQNNNSRIFNTIIRYGGRTGYGNLYLYSNNAPIDSSISSFSSYYGIYLNSASPTITGCEIHHNPTGILLQGSSNPIITQNNILDNTSYGLHNNTNTNNLNATNNYWGASTGPYVTGSDPNLTGTGNRILFNPGTVTYRPFLTSRSGILLGDVSGNGTISAFDGSLILQYLVSQINLTPPQKIAANVSGDTTVSALDASYILRYVVGLISGFPGLGKQSLETDIASAFAFNIEKGQNPNEFDLIIHLNKPTNIYGVNFKLSFDTTLVKPIGMKKTMQSDSMTMVHYFPSGYANVAMAGLKPLNTAGDVARFTFKLLDPAKAMQQVLFTVEKFVLNEMDVTKDVGSIILNVKDIAEIPTTFGLSQNYPNPFNPVTSIKYQIPATSGVRISIYNLLGQEVKILVNEEQSAGFYAILWNGTDNNNRSVASGVYIYRIDASAGEKNHFVQVKKMLMIK